MNLVPTTDLARRVAALCKRKPTTPWSPKEIQVYRRLVKSGFFDNLADLELVEQYYAFERKKGDRGFHRRKLGTYLNHAADELDAATQWREAHPIVKPPRKVIPMPPAPSEPLAPLSPEEQAGVGKFLEQFSTFKKIKAEMGR